MIALYGLVGSRNFTLRHVASRAEGEAWLDAHTKPETQESLGNRRNSTVIPDREARKLRWNNGSKVVDFSDIEYRPADVVAAVVAASILATQQVSS